MAALVACKSIPMAIEEMSEDLSLHFRLRTFFVALPVAGIVRAIRINGRNEQNLPPVWRPYRTVGFCADLCELACIANFACCGVKWREPYLLSSVACALKQNPLALPRS